MGDAKRHRERKAERRARLLSEHPICCFCGGETPADTIDHVPARICFRRTEGPEDFEFPACEACNAAAKLSEQVVAFYLRFGDHDPRNLDVADLRKLVDAVANNAPEALPRPKSSLSAARSALAERGLVAPAGALFEDLPVLDIPRAAQPHFDLFGRKLQAALYYRVTGRILGRDHRLIIGCDQIGGRSARYFQERGLAWFGETVLGARRNVDIGNQFGFRHGYHPGHGFLGTLTEFGLSFTFFGVVIPPEAVGKITVPTLSYRAIRDIAAAS